MSDIKKILLALMPYWDPLIPPNGIAHLKRFLQDYGFQVKTVDVILQEPFQQIYDSYFKLLKEWVPEDHQGNFYNIGHEVLENHLMAHYNYTDEKKYLEAVKQLVYNTYYIHIQDNQVCALNRLMTEFYETLEAYILRLAAEEKPEVLGLTAYRGTLPASLFALKIIKINYPHIKTVIGGGIFTDTHAIGTPNFDTLLEYSKDFLDKIIIGQGELLFLKYLQGELPPTQRVYTRADIKGDILTFPHMKIPDFSDFDFSRYPYLTGAASVSCPYECSFCGTRIFWGEHRVKDPKQTVSEMVELHKLYERQLFFMTDALLNPIVGELAGGFIKNSAPIYYDAYFRVDEATANIENTLLWRRGGLYRVRLGTESGSQRVLDMMGKQITPAMIKAAVSSLALAGIKTTTYWVIGHPGETEEDFQATLDLIEELKDDIYQSEPNPFIYHYSHQSNSSQWESHRKPLYPDDIQDIMVFKTWTLDIEPRREEVYSRLYRFTQHCKKLGIPNPYSLGDYQKAELRWKKLHHNAVPSIMDFLSRKKEYIDEKKNVKLPVVAGAAREDRTSISFEL
ncbi:MAG: hypothetical protein QG657_3872 [Acidobacteriota bacterium]|nr:hypothetical protein [Acidobacteriota bacterium]